jgi:hypothetical protein
VLIRPNGSSAIKRWPREQVEVVATTLAQELANVSAMLREARQELTRSPTRRSALTRYLVDQPLERHNRQVRCAPATGLDRADEWSV